MENYRVSDRALFLGAMYLMSDEREVLAALRGIEQFGFILSTTIDAINRM
jgi:hypothetical protein